jgi:putative nucleotidyltransferase with HDIG domain
MIRILFIDDEARILDGMRRSLYGMRGEWQMRFATSGADALQVLAQEPADVVVSDMRMPGMDGAQLLAEVKRLYPETVRLILSGEAEPAMIIRVTSSAHQYLSKPCDGPILQAAIARTHALRALLSGEHIAAIVGSVDTLPSPPKAYMELLASLRNEDSSTDTVARIIGRDIAMTAKILSIARSGFFGQRNGVQSVERAVTLVGVDTITTLVLGQQLFGGSSSRQLPGFDLQQLADHSFETAACARAVARHEKLPANLAEAAFLGGILHDLGKLVMATRHPPVSATDQPTSLAATLELMQVHHAEVGAYLLGLWGFPDTLVEAVAWHHTPGRVGETSLGLCGLLHIGDLLAHQRATHVGDAPAAAPDQEYLDSIGCANSWPDWLDALPQLPAAMAG